MGREGAVALMRFFMLPIPKGIAALWRTLFAITALLGLIAPARAVVGADTADNPDGVRRHTVAILFARGLCTGVLVARDMIVTAAHCFASNRPRSVVALDRQFKPQFLRVQRFAVHPTFRHARTPMQSSGVDLAVLQLTADVPGDLTPAPIGSFSERGDVFLAGFGVNNNAGGKAGTLRGALLRGRTVDWKAHRLIAAIGIDDQGPKTGIGGCRGDSGGPLFDAENGAVLGIVSWSSGLPGQKKISCGGLTIATEIGDHRAWIAQAINALRAGGPAVSDPPARPGRPAPTLPDPARVN